MRMIGEEETRKGTMVLVRCECGAEIRHPSNRWSVQCSCGKRATMGFLRKMAIEKDGFGKVVAEVPTEMPAEAPRTDSEGQ